MLALLVVVRERAIERFENAAVRGVCYELACDGVAATADRRRLLR
jgi:hypothetical protein